MSELITNGGFTADASWTKGTGWTISGGQAIAAATAANQFLRQSVSVLKGGVYVVTFDVANYASGDVRVSFDGGNNGTARTANGTYTESITLTAASTEIRFGRSTADFTGRIDNVSLQGLSSVVDEQGLSLAMSAWLADNHPSPYSRARTVMQAYLNGGTGSTVQIAVNEAALAAAWSTAGAGNWPSRTRRMRAAIETYIATTAL